MFVFHRHLCQREVSYMSREHGRRGYVFRHRLRRFLYAFGFVRLLALMLRINLNDGPYKYSSRDVFSCLTYHKPKIDSNIYLCFSSIFLLALLSDYLFYDISLESHYWKLIYELIHINTQHILPQFNTLRQQSIGDVLDLPHMLFRPVSTAWRVACFWRGLWHNKLGKLRKVVLDENLHRLVHCPYITTQTRVQVFVMLQLGERILFSFFSLTAFQFVIYVVITTRKMSRDPEIQPSDVFFIFLDSVFVTMMNLEIAKLLLVWLVGSVLMLFVFVRFFHRKYIQIQQLNEDFLRGPPVPSRDQSPNSVTKAYPSSSPGVSSKSKISPLRMRMLMATVRQYMLEHVRTIDYIDSVNRTVWSRALLDFMLTQIPINAYFAIQLAVSQFSQVDDLLYLFIIIFQIVGALNQLLPIANLARQAHKIDAYFVPIQAKLRSEALLSHKMKLMTHYEMLHSAQHKISYTIGPVCYVTYRTIGLIIINYINLLLFIYNLVVNNRKFESVENIQEILKSL